MVTRRSKKKSSRRSSFRDRVRANTKQQKEAKSSYGYLNLPQNVKVYSAKPGGRARFDILPYKVTDPKHPDRNDDLGIATPGELWYRRPFRIHRNIGPDSQTVVCLTSVGKRCPVCDYRAVRMKEGAEKEETDKIRLSNRNLYCVVPLNDRDYDEVPHVWDMSQYTFQDLLNDEMEEDERFFDFPDPENGYTLKVRFDEKQLGGNKYAETSRIDFIEREEPYTNKDLAKVPNLDEVLNIMAAKDLDKLFLGIDDDEEEEEEEEPRRRSRRRRRSRDEEPEEEEEEPEEEEEEPRRSRGRFRRRQEEEPEEEEEEEPEEEEPEEEEEELEEEEEEEPEEEEPPRRRRSKRKSTKKKGKANECPVEGGRFGVDTDDLDECDDCPLWEACIDAKEARESE